MKQLPKALFYIAFCILYFILSTFTFLEYLPFRFMLDICFYIFSIIFCKKITFPAKNLINSIEKSTSIISKAIIISVAIFIIISLFFPYNNFISILANTDLLIKKVHIIFTFFVMLPVIDELLLRFSLFHVLRKFIPDRISIFIIAFFSLFIRGYFSLPIFFFSVVSFILYLQYNDIRLNIFLGMIYGLITHTFSFFLQELIAKGNMILLILFLLPFLSTLFFFPRSIKSFIKNLQEMKK